MAKYKDKKSSGCAMCKPWKHGWAPKHKPKDRARSKQMTREIKSIEKKHDVIDGRLCDREQTSGKNE